MGKLIFLLLSIVLLTTGYLADSYASTSHVFNSDGDIVRVTIPEGWQEMSSENLSATSNAIPDSIASKSGTLVAGFYERNQNKLTSAIQNPKILVFVNFEESINEDMIQKTYMWLQKNNDLVAGVLPSEVNTMHIQDIEYRQEVPGILFQNSLSLGVDTFTGLSAIIFLNNSYLNIVCLADQKLFSNYSEAFHSFIKSVSIPSSLQYASSSQKQNETPIVSKYITWLLQKWQPVLGVLLLTGVYAWVFRPRKVS